MLFLAFRAPLYATLVSYHCFGGCYSVNFSTIYFYKDILWLLVARLQNDLYCIGWGVKL